MATRLRYVGTMLVIMLLLTSCMMPMGGWVGPRALRQYESNGEQIFATGTSQAGRPITIEMDNRGMMGHMGMMVARLAAPVAMVQTDVVARSR